MSCASCAVENDARRRFCRACGATLGVACPRCTFRNEASDRFCGGCGSAVGVAVLPVPRASETAAAVLLSAQNRGAAPARGDLEAASRPPPTRSTVSPLGGGLPALSPSDIANLLTPQGADAAASLVPQLTQAELDRLFGVT